MASSLLRRISQKAAAKVFRVIDPTKRSLLLPPWLMLPPSFKGNDPSILSFKFYSFSDDRVKSFFIKRRGVLSTPLDDLNFVSSSHGWLALFNNRNWDLFLLNPHSGGRQIKLPSLKPLIDVKGVSRLNVHKLITSCSPEEEECRIVMDFGGPSIRKTAFCSPSSGKWSEIRNVDYKPTGDYPCPKYYNDFIYSTNRKRFYLVTQSDVFSPAVYLQAWDLQDTESPNMHEIHQPWGGTLSEEELKEVCKYEIFLVMAECGDLFWVRRYVMIYMEIDERPCVSPLKGIDKKLPYKTIGFDVYKYDIEKATLVYMDGSLDGLALFMGNNHSFAVSAGEFPELKPNSIYFTDNYVSVPENYPFGGHDIGIFNYENKSFSPTCYYPCDRLNLRRIMPAPMWFTPTY